MMEQTLGRLLYSQKDAAELMGMGVKRFAGTRRDWRN
jgi:hypothetical protein